MEADGCEWQRGMLVTEGAAVRGVSRCQQRPTAVCFTYFDRFTGMTTWSCHDEQRDCDRFRSFLQQHRRHELRRVTSCSVLARDSVNHEWQLGSFADITEPEPPWTVDSVGEWEPREGPVGTPGTLSDLTYPSTGEPDLSFFMFALPYAVGVTLDKLPALRVKERAGDHGGEHWRPSDEIYDRRAAELGGLTAIEVRLSWAIERFAILPSGLPVVASCQGYGGHVSEMDRETCSDAFDAVTFTE